MIAANNRERLLIKNYFLISSNYIVCKLEMYRSLCHLQKHTRLDTLVFFPPYSEVFTCTRLVFLKIFSYTWLIHHIRIRFFELCKQTNIDLLSLLAKQQLVSFLYLSTCFKIKEYFTVYSKIDLKELTLDTTLFDLYTK